MSAVHVLWLASLLGAVLFGAAGYLLAVARYRSGGRRPPGPSWQEQAQRADLRAADLQERLRRSEEVASTAVGLEEDLRHALAREAELAERLGRAEATRAPARAAALEQELQNAQKRANELHGALDEARASMTRLGGELAQARAVLKATQRARDEAVQQRVRLQQALEDQDEHTRVQPESQVLAALQAADEEARRERQEAERLRAELQRVQAERAILAGRLEHDQRTAAVGHQELAQLVERSSAEARDLERTRTEAGTLRQETERQQTELAGARARLQEREAALEEARKTAVALEKELALAKSRADLLQQGVAELAALREERDEQRARVAAAEAVAEAAARAARSEEQRSDRGQTAADAQEAAARVARLEEQLSEERQRAARLEEQLSEERRRAAGAQEARGQVERLEGERTELRLQVGRLEADVEALRGAAEERKDDAVALLALRQRAEEAETLRAEKAELSARLRQVIRDAEALGQELAGLRQAEERRREAAIRLEMMEAQLAELSAVKDENRALREAAGRVVELERRLSALEQENAGLRSRGLALEPRAEPSAVERPEEPGEGLGPRLQAMLASLTAHEGARGAALGDESGLVVAGLGEDAEALAAAAAILMDRARAVLRSTLPLAGVRQLSISDENDLTVCTQPLHVSGQPMLLTTLTRGPGPAPAEVQRLAAGTKTDR